MTNGRKECIKEDPCEPKYVALINESIPNQNKSHITVERCEGPDAYRCLPQDTRGLPKVPQYRQGEGCYDICTGHQRSCNCPECGCKREAVLERDCPQHTEGNRWLDLGRKFRDPEVKAIHERLKSSDGIKSLLCWGIDDEQLPCVLRRYRNSNTGYLGQARVHYGAAQDCDFPKAMVHGVVDYDIIPGGKLITPPPKTWVQQLETDLAESIYASNKLAPVGSSHDQLSKLPPKIHPDSSTFGKPSHKDVSAGDLINPKKDRYFVEEESECCRHLYRKTHLNYAPGEQVCRNYENPFRRTNTFGDLTPHDIAGRPCALVIGNWRKCAPDPPIVSKVYADHLEQRLPKIGIPQNRFCLPPDTGTGPH